MIERTNSSIGRDNTGRTLREQIYDTKNAADLRGVDLGLEAKIDKGGVKAARKVRDHILHAAIVAPTVFLRAALGRTAVSRIEFVVCILLTV